MLNIYGPINDLGYGIVTRGLIKGLMSLGIDTIHLDIISKAQIEQNDKNNKELQIINQLTKNFWNRCFPSVAVWHEFDLSKFSGNKLIALPIFETDDFFHIAKNYLSQMDAVVVLSSWAKEIVLNKVRKDLPVFVVPASANILPEIDNLFIPKSNCFSFLSVGKLEFRKGHIDLIQSYVNAFESEQADTRLRLHCFSPFEQNFAATIGSIFHKLDIKLVNTVQKSSCITGVKGRAIVEIPLGRISEMQLAQLYKNSHIGVFPSRGEGWNLPLMECIQYGTPAIASNYSAHTEYLTPEFSYPQDLLLNKGTLGTAIDGKFFHGDRGQWMHPNLDELSEKLLYSYKNYDSIIKNFDNSKLKETFTWENSATRLIDVTNSL